MKRTLVRYKAKPDRADENARLIEATVTELRAKSLTDVRYLALRLSDGTFIHFSIADGDVSPIPSLDAFKAFQSGIKDRCLEPPQQTDVTIVGNYRMLDEG
jgi:hypothetical protein